MGLSPVGFLWDEKIYNIEVKYRMLIILVNKKPKDYDIEMVTCMRDKTVARTTLSTTNQLPELMST